MRSLGLAVWHFVTGAPLTYGWFLILMITTAIQHALSRRQLHMMLMHHSTNVHALARDPLDVLFASLLWIDGRSLEPYLLLFTLFLAPAEHWLGHLRWLTVGLTSHILSTYVSEGLLYLAIERRDAAERLVNARDIGVSYFLMGVMGVLAYHIARPWRWGYLAVILLIVGFPLLTMDRIELSFTAIGHVTAVLIGLCFYPMASARGGATLNPVRIGPALRRGSASPRSG
ncbi:MAG: rhomboid-like protein [Mycobacterium sp.]